MVEMSRGGDKCAAMIKGDPAHVQSEAEVVVVATDPSRVATVVVVKGKLCSKGSLEADTEASIIHWHLYAELVGFLLLFLYQRSSGSVKEHSWRW